MKTYDEITENVLEGAKIYRRKIRRTQCAVSVVAMSTACALGLTLYSNLERVDHSQPEQTTDSYTEFSSNLPTMNASNDPENSDMLCSEPPPPQTKQSAFSPSFSATSMTVASTIPAPTTDPTEAIVPEILETSFPETATIETTAVPVSTVPETTALISTTAPPAVTTSIHTTTTVATTTYATKATTSRPLETTAPPPETEIVLTTEPITTEPPTEEIPEVTGYFSPEPLTEPTEETATLPIQEPDTEPTEEPSTQDPTEMPSTEPDTTQPEPATDPTETELSEIEAFKQAHPELSLTDEEWEVMFLLYSDSDLPFAFWYEMFGGTP